MGPRLFRRGNLYNTGNDAVSSWGFNGATSFQTWKCAAGDLRDDQANRLQWGHVFSDVEMTDIDGVDKTYNVASMGPRLFRRGNYAPETREGIRLRASMGPRLFRRGNLKTHPSSLPRNKASMGPRLFRRGNDFSRCIAWTWIACFNGATSFQTWKFRNRRSGCSRFPPCFNGATSFQTWK